MTHDRTIHIIPPIICKLSNVRPLGIMRSSHPRRQSPRLAQHGKSMSDANSGVSRPSEILKVEDARSCQLVAEEMDKESLVCVSPRLTAQLQICPRIAQARGSTTSRDMVFRNSHQAFIAICIEYMRLDKAWWST